MKMMQFLCPKILIRVMLAACLGMAQTLQAAPFTVSTDGQEVTDEATGLIWKRCPYGTVFKLDACVGVPQYVMWYEALAEAETYSRAQKQLWRVPNVKELATLLDRSLIDRAIDANYFPTTPSAPFWSSTPYTSDAFFGWGVHFFDGSVYYTYLEDLSALRLVRDR